MKTFLVTYVHAAGQTFVFPVYGPTGEETSAWAILQAESIVSPPDEPRADAWELVTADAAREFDYVAVYTADGDVVMIREG